MKRQSVKLIAELLAVLVGFILFILYEPELSSAISNLFNNSPASPSVNVASPTEFQAFPTEAQATPTIPEIRKELSRISTNDNDVLSMDISTDGNWLATGYRDGTAKIWDIASHQEFLAAIGDAGFADGLAFSPDGALLAVSYENGMTILWDSKTGEKLWILSGNSSATSNDFSPDGNASWRLVIMTILPGFGICRLARSR